MKRREFAIYVGLGLGGSILPVALANCNAQTREEGKAGAATYENDFIEVGDVGQLEQTGQIFNEVAIGKVLVIKAPANPEKLIAINPTCPHSGCIVTWESERQKFLCPCHNSEFSSEGEVLKGLATKPLSKYEVKVEGSSILVKTI
jgi:cytochrome b6-f complex iron-sulfur subunit